VSVVFLGPEFKRVLAGPVAMDVRSVAELKQSTTLL